MTYGHSTRVFIEDGPACRPPGAECVRSTARSWRALDADRRLELDRAGARPANDRIDGFPLAL